MSHTPEVAEAERQRALAAGDYCGGYAIGKQPPVLVFSSERTQPETDADRIARLAREVGRLTYELRQAREEAGRLRGWFAPKGMSVESAPYDGKEIPVAVTRDAWSDDTDRTVVEAVCIAGHWINACELGAFGEALQAAKDAE